MTIKNPIYLFSKQPDSWEKISRKLRKASNLALFLDYDGTLTPIRHTPSAATLGSETEQLLWQLANLPDVYLTIVTGRSMEDIKRLVPIENITFIANHGFHIFRDGSEWIHPEAISLIQTLKRLSFTLNQALDKFPKAQVENKQFTLSIHYRNIPVRKTSSLMSIVRKTVHSFDPRLILTPGKKVLEVRPQVKWGKGKAVLQVLKTSNLSGRPTAIFIGDDKTDEDVFRVLRFKGIMIRVGKERKTDAVYYVKDVGEVLQLLRSLITLRTSNSSPDPTKRK